VNGVGGGGVAATGGSAASASTDRDRERGRRVCILEWSVEREACVLEMEAGEIGAGECGGSRWGRPWTGAVVGGGWVRRG
jgi:hypothetical protein